MPDLRSSEVLNCTTTLFTGAVFDSKFQHLFLGFYTPFSSYRGNIGHYSCCSNLYLLIDTKIWFFSARDMKKQEAKVGSCKASF